MPTKDHLVRTQGPREKNYRQRRGGRMREVDAFEMNREEDGD